MAKGYGFEVNDWVLIAVVAGAAYFLYKGVKGIKDIPSDLMTGIGTTAMSGANKAVEAVQVVEKSIWNGTGIRTTPKGFVPASQLKPINYQDINPGMTPAGNQTKHTTAVKAAIKSGGYYSSGTLNQKVQPVSITPAGNQTKHASAVASAISKQNYYVGKNMLVLHLLHYRCMVYLGSGCMSGFYLSLHHIPLLILLLSSLTLLRMNS